MEKSLADRSSPLLDLRTRCLDLAKVLPDEPPEIKTHYSALTSLRTMGIEAPSPTNTPALVNLANRMQKVHNLLHRGLLEGRTWQEIYDDPKSDKSALSEYRELRLEPIKRQVGEQAGVTVKFVDRKDRKRIYYFTAEGSEAERRTRFWQASYLLGAIALSMGDNARPLKDFLGHEADFDYEKRLLAERDAERAKAEADRAKAQAATA